ncbi:MAG TPA: universal stress protein [Chthoniobacterales bacterium]|jgi:nucleotide-binding universal stress UspA family protein|nr:universal stress protein [Chthoniobacterales bacterium]
MKTLAVKSSGKARRATNRILVAVDLSRQSEATALLAARVAKAFDADLTVAHVFPSEPRYDFVGEGTFRAFERRRHKKATLLDQLTKKVRQIAPEAEWTFLVGDPADEIAAFAYDNNIDLIVTGGHKVDIFSGLFRLNEPSNIVRQARCSVLV